MIKVETTIDDTIERVWKAYTSPDDIVNWNSASPDWHTTSATVDLREGGRFSSRMEAKDGSMGFDFEGVYTNIVEHELIEYSMEDRMALVTFAVGIDGVRVQVEFEAEGVMSAEQQQAGWQAILDNFNRYVSSGS